MKAHALACLDAKGYPLEILSGMKPKSNLHESSFPRELQIQNRAKGFGDLSLPMRPAKELCSGVGEVMLQSRNNEG